MLKRIKKFVNKRKENDISEQIKRDSEQINEQYKRLINAQIEFQDRIQKSLDPFDEYFDGLREWADAELRLQDSIIRAREAGVPEDKILHNMEEGERFFCI